MIWPWLLTTFVLSGFLGAGAGHYASGAWQGWYGLSVENREARRQRRCRDALAAADELLARGRMRSAMHAARRAHRLDPGNPDTMWGVGRVLAARRRYEAAIRHFEEAYHEMEAGQDDSLAPMAVEAVRCCARLRRDARSTLESEIRAEQILSWARVAARMDPYAVLLLADDPLLRDLCASVRLLQDPMEAAA